MPKINVLPKHISELIAAGEVVERPSSVVKELVENSIDAGATKITVEIKRGGILYMSVKDNGCGISREDVKTAFLRHATSKIKQKDDLDSILTLGFRGEALASVSAVARVELITRRAEDEEGTRYTVEGSVEGEIEDIGSDVGTLIAVRDIFYNTPARMKFLKSDVTEGNSVAAVMDRIALSHPEIAFRFIRDGKQVLTTSGDGSLENTIYAVLGRDFASSLIEVSGENEGIRISGKICKPIFCRQNRNGQFFFLNGRLIRSGTASAALEQAYKNSVMVGKFPCCVMFINLPAGSVDVNVHPSKMEVRFSDERAVFSAVYYAVKTALTVSDTRPELKHSSINPYAPIADKSEQLHISIKPSAAPTSVLKETPAFSPAENKAEYKISPLAENVVARDVFSPKKSEQAENEYFIITPPKKAEQAAVVPPADKAIRYIGQAFDTYIIAEMDSELYLIDKHAAHERLLYEGLKASQKIEVQQLLVPQSVALTKEEYSVLTDNAEALEKTGFYIEDFGGSHIAVRAVPAILKNEDISLLITEMAGKLLEGRSLSPDRIDDIFHTVACKAAIKGNRYTSAAELEALAKEVLSTNDIMYCPHGRPVAFKLTKNELEKHFGRIQ